VRIAAKITVAVSSWTILVLMVDGWLKHLESHELIQRDLFDESVLAVNLIRPSIEAASRLGGAAAVQATVGAVQVAPDDLQFDLVQLVPGATLPPTPPLSALAAGLNERSGAPFFVLFGDEQPRLYSYVPVPELGPHWQVQVSASLGDQSAHDRSFAKETVVLIALISGMSAVLAGWTGWVQIGRRVRDLADLARATGRGVDPPRLPTDGGDELAALAVEMNQMADQLAEMRSRTEAEAALRSRLREELRHADRLGTMGMMMSRVAHEIGTPLNVISARVRKIARGQVEGEAAKENARIAAEQTERIALVIRRMLDFSRREGARGPAEARGLAETSIAMVEALARSNDQRLILDDRSAGAEVWVEPVLIEQALVNLLINAISASPPGGEIRLQLSVLEDDASAEDDEPELRICFAVEDEGPGVPAELASQVFEPFFTTKPLGEGTGLGLAITKTIVTEHGGELRIGQGSSSGARFEIILRRSEAGTAERMAAAEIAPVLRADWRKGG
jgi:signal transduction histidine kinase